MRDFWYETNLFSLVWFTVLLVSQNGSVRYPKFCSMYLRLSYKSCIKCVDSVVVIAAGVRKYPKPSRLDIDCIDSVVVAAGISGG